MRAVPIAAALFGAGLSFVSGGSLAEVLSAAAFALFVGPAVLSLLVRGEPQHEPAQNNRHDIAERRRVAQEEG